MKKLITIILMAVTFTANAQYQDFALQFSEQYMTGTARATAMGNAFGALGGDFSALSINPASVGVFRKSEFSITMAPLNHMNNSTFYQRASDVQEKNSNSFNMGNVGFISTIPIQNNDVIKSFNFGFGFNRLNNFDDEIRIFSSGSAHSLTDVMALNANGTSSADLESDDRYDNGSDWTSAQGWNAYLINENGSNTEYVSILEQGQEVEQRKVIERYGYNNEYVISLGANIQHKLYVGATLGIQDILYEEYTKYSEDWEAYNHNNYFDLINTQYTRGTGVNIKIGAIARPIKSLRLGFAFHSPTYLNLYEEYEQIMNSSIVEKTVDGPGDIKNRNQTSNINNLPRNNEFELQTPLRMVASAAYTIGKRGILSFDYEYADYSTMKYTNGFGWESVNSAIDQAYTQTHNYRIGGEARVSQNLSLRAGYQIFATPYSSSINGVEQPNKNWDRYSYSGGFGYSNKDFYFDVAYMYTQKESYSYLYSLADIESVKTTQKTNQLMMTLGLKF